VFPEGIYYCKENNECRTDKVNPLFSQIAQLKELSAQKNSGNINDYYYVAASVATGLNLSNFITDLQRLEILSKSISL